MPKLYNHTPTLYDICEIDKTPYACLHEVFYGSANAKLSRYYGMQVRLSYKNHQDHTYGVHNWKDFNLCLKHVYHILFTRWYPELDFYSIFRKNYILSKEEFEERLGRLPESHVNLIYRHLEYTKPTFGDYKKDRLKQGH